MIETVFVIALTFTNWDDCWNHAHKHGLLDAEEVCAMWERPQPPRAPSVSLRPKVRPWKDGEKK